MSSFGPGLPPAGGWKRGGRLPLCGKRYYPQAGTACVCTKDAGHWTPCGMRLVPRV